MKRVTATPGLYNSYKKTIETFDSMWICCELVAGLQHAAYTNRTQSEVIGGSIIHVIDTPLVGSVHGKRSKAHQ